MTPREANVLLTRAALLDGRLRREPGELAQMATAWAGVLVDVPIDLAVAALALHYREQTRAVMPADIIALLDDVTPADIEPEQDTASWLAARGIDSDAFAARLAAGERPTRALRELGAEVSS
jgi:hypothetical protein